MRRALFQALRELRTLHPQTSCPRDGLLLFLGLTAKSLDSLLFSRCPRFTAYDRMRCIFIVSAKCNKAPQLQSTL